MRLLAAGVVAGVLAAVAVGGPVAADGPPGPAPYPKIPADSIGPPELTCRDSDGTLLYSQSAWTLEPLVRGPLFAPVVLWLAEAGNAPVVPLEFRGQGFPLQWSTADDGPAESGAIESFGGRPVGYGPAPEDPAPRVSCGFALWGSYDFGTYLITAGLADVLGLPDRLVGRRLTFGDEGWVGFSVPRYLFPLTATVAPPTLPTADQPAYPRLELPPVACRHTATGAVAYRGGAYTLAPLVRGYGWAPMALWLRGDRILTPRWFTSSVRGTWRTVSGTPARAGTLDARQAGRPAGYGGRPGNATTGVDCRWSGEHHATVTVTTALAAQLGLPTGLLGRQVALDGSHTVHAYTGAWLFPPR